MSAGTMEQTVPANTISHLAVYLSLIHISCFFIENSDSSDVLAPIVQTRISQHLHETLSPHFYTECVPVASDQVICLINTIEAVSYTHLFQESSCFFLLQKLILAAIPCFYTFILPNLLL